MVTVVASAGSKELAFESVTGVRSSYVHRGTKLADTTFDFQFHGIFSYDEDRDLEYGLWYAGETNTGGFAEIGVTMRYSEYSGDWGYFVGMQGRFFEYDVIDSGVELDAGAIYQISRDHSISAIVSHDTSTHGWYADVSYQGIFDMTEKSFFIVEVGVSGAANYYGRDGFNDMHTRLTYTHNVNDFLSLSPFTSFVVTDDENYLTAGVWFEVSF